MELRVSQPGEIPELVRISKAAFDTDNIVGGVQPGGPPEYDSLSWHMEMMEGGKLYTAVLGDIIVGGAVVFPDHAAETVYVGRIFVDPSYFRKGYGAAIMERIEEMFAGYLCRLDTPLWNTRTNRFYRKLGYLEERRDAESVYYRKHLRHRRKLL